MLKNYVQKWGEEISFSVRITGRIITCNCKLTNTQYFLFFICFGRVRTYLNVDLGTSLFSSLQDLDWQWQYLVLTQDLLTDIFLHSTLSLVSLIYGPLEKSLLQQLCYYSLGLMHTKSIDYFHRSSNDAKESNSSNDNTVRLQWTQGRHKGNSTVTSLSQRLINDIFIFYNHSMFTLVMLNIHQRILAINHDGL